MCFCHLTAPAVRCAGAGLDTRPWRLALGRDVSWFEVDLPSMTSFKHSCMERAGMQAAAAPSDAGKGLGERQCATAVRLVGVTACGAVCHQQLCLLDVTAVAALCATHIPVFPAECMSGSGLAVLLFERGG